MPAACAGRPERLGALTGSASPSPAPQLEDFFHKYGRITEITIRNRKPPAFAYVEFADPRDADDAVRGRNGVDFGGGFPVKCDIAKEERRGFGPGPYGGPPMGGRSAFPPSRKTRYKVIVEGLPESASWQDLKDHMREAGDVTYVQVYRDDKGTYGLVDYATLDDMERAIRKIDDTKVRFQWRGGGFSSRRPLNRCQGFTWSRTPSLPAVQEPVRLVLHHGAGVRGPRGGPPGPASPAVAVAVAVSLARGPRPLSLAQGPVAPCPLAPEPLAEGPLAPGPLAAGEEPVPAPRQPREGLGWRG